MRALVTVGPGPACDFDKAIPDTDAGRGPEWGAHSNFPLRQAMLSVTTAADLRKLLQTHGPELGPADVAAAWHVAVQQRLLTLARSGDAGEAALASHLLALAAAHVDAMDPAALSTVAWALAASASGNAATMDRILSAAGRRMVQFSPPQLCTLLWAAAAHPALEHAARAGPFVALAGLVDSGMVLDLFSPRDLSILLWSMGKAAYAHPAVLTAAETACAARMDEFTPGDAARAMHGFAMVRHNPLAVRRPLQERWGSREAIAAFSPDDLTRLLVAHGVLGLEPDYAFMRAAVQHASTLVPAVGRSSRRSHKKKPPPPPTLDLHPRHLAHILWALARLDFRPGDAGLFNRIMLHMEAFPGAYAADDISAILWACSRLELVVPEATMEAAAQRATFLAPREAPEAVASLLRHLAAAAATAGCAPSGARKFAAVGAAVLVPVAGKLDPEALASVVVALGALEMPPLPLAAAVRLQRAVVAAAGRFNSDTLPQLTWAAVRLRWTAPRLQEALCSAATFRAPLVPPEGLAQLAWAFAGMDRTHQPLAEALASQCLAKLRFFAPKDKARLAWAMAHLAPRHPAAITQRHLKAVVQSIEKSELAKLDAVSVAAVAWACGRLDRHPGPVLEAAAQRALVGRSAFTREQIAHMKAVLAKHGSALAEAL